jgi:signal peptidase
MAVPEDKNQSTGFMSRFLSSEAPAVVLAREILWVLAVVAGIALFLFLVSGTWPAVVTIESESMVPHMNVGDLVFVVDANRYGDLQTWEGGKETGYKKFGDYGDVIIYEPNGAKGALIPGIGGGVHPIIHRAMTTVPEGSSIPVYYYPYSKISSPGVYLPATIVDNKIVLENGTIVDEAPLLWGYNVSSTGIAPHTGLITKGDNNNFSDQGSPLSRSELGIIQPVRNEWIVGKALFAIPLVGYIPLNIVPVAIILILLMLIYEYYQRTKKQDKQAGKKQPTKKKRQG